MAPRGCSWLSVGYISAAESRCPPLKTQPQHSSVYLISVFACSLKLPQRRKGFVMRTMCDCWRRWERLKQRGELKECGFICQSVSPCIWFQTSDWQPARCYRLLDEQRGRKWTLILEIVLALWVLLEARIANNVLDWIRDGPIDILADYWIPYSASIWIDRW